MMNKRILMFCVILNAFSESLFFVQIRPMFLSNLTWNKINRHFGEKNFVGEHHDGNYEIWNCFNDNEHPFDELDDEASMYTDLFAVHIGKENGTHFASRNGLILIKKIFEDEDIYLFRHPTIGIENASRSSDIIKNISMKNKIQWIIQQHVLHRHHRSFETKADLYLKLDLKEDAYSSQRFFPTENSYSEPIFFNDPLFKDQWYLYSDDTLKSKNYHDINVMSVWKAGITGKNIRISVLDDGVSNKNAEITKNYDPQLSYEFAEFKDKKKTEIPENSHGTYCAAIVAGVANNNYCGVGVAYNARIGGAKVLNGPITDAQEALGIISALKYVDIYTASWGPEDDGQQVAGPGFLTRKALIKGVTKGRNGKGSIYVWASGNGGKRHDNCNLDGYASSPFTLTFGALTENGESTYYSEPCAAVIASTYVGGLHFPPTKKNLASYRKMIKVIVPDACGKCRKNFQGTSAAAPIAAGVIALILEANSALTWRDVQHIIIKTAKIPSSSEMDWSLNAAGKHFHPKIGFGAIDAALAVSVARNWTLVKNLNRFSTVAIRDKKIIEPSLKTVLTVQVPDNIQKISSLETVVATINIVHPRCGNLEIYLISPAKTVSQILSKRPEDNKNRRLKMWNFVSMHFWGENPSGLWTLQILDHNSPIVGKGYINYFKFAFYGTILNKPFIRMFTPKKTLTKMQLNSIMNTEKIASQAALKELMQP